MAVYSPKISQNSTIFVENNTFRRLFFLDITIKHGTYYRTHHFIANFFESKRDNTELSHQYCADIDDGIRTKYLVTTMIISHFNQSSTLGSKSRKLQITKSGLSVFIHLKYTALEKLIEDRNISREISSQIQMAVGQANLGGRLENFLFSQQNRLR